jgi:hypothetical protein
MVKGQPECERHHGRLSNNKERADLLLSQLASSSVGVNVVCPDIEMVTDSKGQGLHQSLMCILGHCVLGICQMPVKECVDPIKINGKSVAHVCQ